MEPTKENKRPYDVVIMGATGFTGRLVADYLLKTYGVNKDVKWAMAGRNLDKMQLVRSELGNEEIPLIQADSFDASSLDAMTQQTKVLCTTVGPYAKYGDETVASCVRSGTHYCDLTGEVQWIRRMIDAHHAEASAKKLKITHCCGFDSIPSDIGVYWLQQQAQELTGMHCQHIKTGVKAAKGGFSGGTIDSLLNVMDEAQKDKSIYGILFNPYSLNPEGEQQGPDRGDLRAVKYDEHFQSWKCPFVMASINTRVVRRGHALRGFPYGKDFRYDEVTLTGDGFSGKVKGYMTSIPLGIVMSAKPGTLSRWLVDRFTPDAGEGPDKKTRETGFWVYDQVGLLPDGRIIKSRIKGDRDPGYGSTSKMLAEAAVCLAQDDLPEMYGVVTPASAMGDALLQRLQERAGLSFAIKEAP